VTAQVKEVYECLDPRGHTPEKPKIPLRALRPADLKGKNLLVAIRESFPNVMPAVRSELLRQVPDVNVVWWDFDQRAGLTVEQAKNEAKADAVIIGVGY
jgi:hypothetical protein